MKKGSQKGTSSAKPDESLEVDENLRCLVCNTKIEFYVDTLYNGTRGRCTKCGINWPES